MSILNTVSGLGLMEKPKPLISFTSIIDEKMSLIKFVIKHMGNDYRFDKIKDLYKMSYLDILFMVYSCPSKNPLHLVSSRGEEELQELYEIYMNPNNCFLDHIYNLAVSTEMYNVLLSFKQSTDIIPSILCYTEEQKKVILNNQQTSDIVIYLPDEVKTDFHTQFYFEYFEDALPYKELSGRTFYISSKYYNLDMEKKFSDLDPVYNDDISYMIKRGNKINIFDMYNMEILKKTNEYKKMKDKNLIE